MFLVDLYETPILSYHKLNIVLHCFVFFLGFVFFRRNNMLKTDLVLQFSTKKLYWVLLVRESETLHTIAWKLFLI